MQYPREKQAKLTERLQRMATGVSCQGKAPPWYSMPYRELVGINRPTTRLYSWSAAAQKRPDRTAISRVPRNWLRRDTLFWVKKRKYSWKEQQPKTKNKMALANSMPLMLASIRPFDREMEKLANRAKITMTR